MLHKYHKLSASDQPVKNIERRKEVRNTVKLGKRRKRK